MAVSLHRQLLLSALAILLASTAIGALAIYIHALSKVRLEMDAALAVSKQFLARGISDLRTEPDPERRLVQIVDTFNGDRHVSVTLAAASGSITAQSTVLQPQGPAPAWFLRLVGSRQGEMRYALPASLTQFGAFSLRSYPANEVAEAWSDAKLTAGIVAVFFIFVLAMIIWLQRRAFHPLLQLQEAFVQVGAGRYETRVANLGYVELQPVLTQFNAMAGQLAQVEQQKNQLQAQLQRIQDDEGAALARELHDDVAPFLVAVGTDAALIRHSLSEGAIASVDGYANTIIGSVSHMQRHLRDILARLRAGTLAELGLANGIYALIEFWQQRRSDLAFDVDIPILDVSENLGHLAFRIVQEAVTNAVRHGKPKKVTVHIRERAGNLEIEVEDDGKGFDARTRLPGFGITGMQERAISVGGALRITARPGGGTSVQAQLPLASEAAP